MSTTRTNLSLLASKPASAPLNLIYRFYRLVSAIRYRVPRRFSHAGLAVLIALGAAGLLGVDTENSVAYQAVTLLTALLGTAVCFGWRFRGRFSVNRVLPRFGTVGQPIKFEVRIKNLTTRTQRGLTLLEDLRDPRPTFKEWLAFARSRQLHGRSLRVSPLRASRASKSTSRRFARVAGPSRCVSR